MIQTMVYETDLTESDNKADVDARPIKKKTGEKNGRTGQSLSLIHI